MKLIFIVSVLLGLSAPAFAAQNVYLKDGGVIEARKVWRDKGKVQVLVNRYTQTEFWPSEIDMKRTFPKDHKAKHSKKPAAAKTAAPNGAAATQGSTGKKSGVILPSQPKLPESSPASGTKEEGAIKKHKREMLERTGE